MPHHADHWLTYQIRLQTRASDRGDDRLAYQVMVQSGVPGGGDDR